MAFNNELRDRLHASQRHNFPHAYHHPNHFANASIYELDVQAGAQRMLEEMVRKKKVEDQASTLQR
jgi:tRNA A37 methylthiotransferase MiaB